MGSVADVYVESSESYSVKRPKNRMQMASDMMKTTSALDMPISFLPICILYFNVE